MARVNCIITNYVSQLYHEMNSFSVYFRTNNIKHATCLLALWRRIECLGKLAGDTMGRKYSHTVEPLSNDHPHQRPSLLYDNILCDGGVFCFCDP